MSAMCGTRDILAIGFSNGVFILFNTQKLQICHVNKVSMIYCLRLTYVFRNSPATRQQSTAWNLLPFQARIKIKLIRICKLQVAQLSLKELWCSLLWVVNFHTMSFKGSKRSTTFRAIEMSSYLRHTIWEGRNISQQSTKIPSNPYVSSLSTTKKNSAFSRLSIWIK